MNLFIVSNLGQLIQAQNVIKQNDLIDNVLVVLWTKRNTVVRDNIINNVDNQFFSNVDTLQLPNFPNKFHVNNLMKIRKDYNHLIENYPFTDVFVCNYNSHYNFLYDIAKAKNININIFEEGLGTYKFKVVLDKMQENNKIKFIERFTIAQNFAIKDFKQAIKQTDLFKWLVFLLLFIKNNLFNPLFILLKGMARICLSFFPIEFVNKIKKIKTPKELRSFDGTIPMFDKAYFTFPDQGSELFKAKQYNELKLDYQLKKEVEYYLKNSQTLSLLDRKSVIFLDQVYNVPPEKHTEIIMKYLNEFYPQRNIFIKMHPRSKTEVRKSFEDKIKKYNNIRLIELDVEMPFEAILVEKKPKTIVSLTSTSLVYGPKLISGTEVVSCANYYLRNIKSANIKDNVLKEIEVDRDTLKVIGGVTFN
ncbi:alpha-2,8-polysialyltransferase family protein [Halalkalibacter okhensis]|uniref:Uncharacterized protein n=1 Tax=Halalkalibacter okhensis TaxID=333138 RepID=A0A0B0IGB5_9BACI|nr:alpha-2,8-polysialyltransferase family protein [Halalkalibacter okhensis]KHF38716.1 hypothetical protein LQ50_19770 [Halalkalibacter okhensis]